MEVAEIKHRLKAAGAQLPVERFSNAELLRYGHACGLLKVSRQHKDKAAGLSWIERMPVSEPALIHCQGLTSCALKSMMAHVLGAALQSYAASYQRSYAGSMYLTHYTRADLTHSLCDSLCNRGLTAIQTQILALLLKPS